MAKALGLIGNFKGKLGNTVGYSLKDSNNKQTQGVRVYQPVVRNPKTAAQAEQRAKLAPINATYRALKMVIDRGQEGKAYGNKSRLAWLSAAMKTFNGGWFVKGEAITAPALVPLTDGSLTSVLNLTDGFESISINYQDYAQKTPYTIDAFTAIMLDMHPQLKEGDQITFVAISADANGIQTMIESIVLSTTDKSQLGRNFEPGDNSLVWKGGYDTPVAGAIILSREGSNGEHLRSKTTIVKSSTYPATVLAEAAKQAAIESYMSQGANTDWAEESLM